MRILGIDPGSLATGFGIVEIVHRREPVPADADGTPSASRAQTGAPASGGRLVHVAHGTLRAPRGADLATRLGMIHRGIEEVIRTHEPEVAAVERVFVSASARSALVLGQARGSALAALGAAALHVHELDTRQVKQAVVGTGSASKAQVQAMVARLLELDRRPAPDAADALAVAICHAHRGRLGELADRAVGAASRSRGGGRGRGRGRRGARFVVRRAT